MDFRDATDQLIAHGIGLQEIAEALGVAYTTVRAYRLDPQSESYRAPPTDWAAKLARLARQTVRDTARLATLAEQLEREG